MAICSAHARRAAPSRACPRPHRRPRYGAVAIALHWLLALLIVGSLRRRPVHDRACRSRRMRLKLYNWHKWAGMTILALSALRLLWRLTHRPPPLPAAIGGDAGLAAHARRRHAPAAVRAVLRRAAVRLGLQLGARLPDRLVRRAAAARLRAGRQGAGRSVLQAAARTAAPSRWPRVVLLHVAAALKHQFVDRDGLLARMWPRRARKPADEASPIALRCLAAALALLACGRGAGARRRREAACPRQSEIVFVSKQMGVPVEGKFRKFDAQIALRSEEARGRHGRAADRHWPAPRSARRETDAELPKADLVRHRAVSRRPASSRARSRAWAAAASRSPASSTIKGQRATWWCR